MDSKKDDPFVAALNAIMRLRPEITQKCVAEKVGITQSAVHYIVTGKREGRPKTLSAIAKALGFKMSEFLQFGERILKGDHIKSLSMLESMIAENTIEDEKDGKNDKMNLEEQLKEKDRIIEDLRQLVKLLREKLENIESSPFQLSGQKPNTDS